MSRDWRTRTYVPEWATPLARVPRAVPRPRVVDRDIPCGACGAEFDTWDAYTAHWRTLGRHDTMGAVNRVLSPPLTQPSVPTTLPADRRVSVHNNKQPNESNTDHEFTD